MYLLDTDHVSLLEWGQGPDARRLRERIARVSPGDVLSSIISYEEQTRGWLAFLSKARTTAGIALAYDRLLRHLLTWREIPVLPFDSNAAVEFEGLRRLKLRASTLDLRIASIALAHDATLLTRNRRDFQGIPRLILEDWTA